MLGKQEKKQGRRWRGAIVEVVEGVTDHQPQRPFSSLQESLLMVALFLCLIAMQSDGSASSAMTSPTEVVL